MIAGGKKICKDRFYCGTKGNSDMPGDLLFGEKKYLETVFFVEKEIFWREEIPGSKKEALKTVAYHEISFFLVREKIHIFLQKKEGPRNSSIPGDFFLERT